MHSDNDQRCSSVLVQARVESYYEIKPPFCRYQTLLCSTNSSVFCVILNKSGVHIAWAICKPQPNHHTYKVLFTKQPHHSNHPNLISWCVSGTLVALLKIIFLRISIYRIASLYYQPVKRIVYPFYTKSSSSSSSHILLFLQTVILLLFVGWIKLSSATV